MNNVILYGRFFDNKAFSRVRTRKKYYFSIKNRSKFYRLSSKVTFELDEYARWDWSNDPRKFYRNYSMRDLNIRRNQKGKKMLSPLNKQW